MDRCLKAFITTHRTTYLSKGEGLRETRMTGWLPRVVKREEGGEERNAGRRDVDRRV